MAKRASGRIGGWDDSELCKYASSEGERSVVVLEAGILMVSAVSNVGYFTVSVSQFSQYRN